MRKLLSIIFASSVLVAAGCASFKQYPTVLPLTEFEEANFSCKEIKNEFQKLEVIRAEVNREDSDIYKSTVDFVTDLGIGNEILKKELTKKIKERESKLKRLKAKNNC